MVSCFVLPFRGVRFAGVLALAALSLPLVASAATTGSDVATNYTATGWTSGSNGGTGFNA